MHRAARSTDIAAKVRTFAGQGSALLELVIPMKVASRWTGRADRSSRGTRLAPEANLASVAALRDIVVTVTTTVRGPIVTRALVIECRVKRRGKVVSCVVVGGAEELKRDNRYLLVITFR